LYHLFPEFASETDGEEDQREVANQGLPETRPLEWS